MGQKEGSRQGGEVTPQCQAEPEQPLQNEQQMAGGFPNPSFGNDHLEKKDF